MRSREVSGWKHLGRRVAIREWFNTKAGARFDEGDHAKVIGFWKGLFTIHAPDGRIARGVRASQLTFIDPENKPSPVPAHIMEQLEAALEASRMTECSIREEHKEAMRGYMRSWIEGPLAAAISAMKKGTRYEDKE